MMKIFFLFFLFLSFLLSGDGLRGILGSGELNGAIQLQHDDISSKDRAQDAHAATLGGFLQYRTKPYKNSFFNIMFNTVNPVSSLKNQKKTGFLTDDKKSVDSLVEAYLCFVDGKHSLKIGREQLDTPLMNSNEARVIPYSYSGFRYLWKNDSSGKIAAGSVSLIKKPTEREFSATGDSGYAEEGILYLGTESRNWGYDYKIYYYRAKEMFDSLFFQIDKNVDVGRWRLYSGIQYIKTYKNGTGKNIDPQRENGGSDVQISAIRAGFRYEKAGLLAAYSQNSGADGLAKAYGGQAELFTNSMITSGISRGGPETVSLRFKYDWSREISSKVIYADTRFRLKEHPGIPGSYTNDFDTLYFDTKYSYDRDSYIYAGYEHMDREYKNTDMDYLRVVFVQGF